MVIRLRTKPRLEIEAEVNSKMAHKWYSLDVIAAMLVQKKKKQKRNKSWGFDFVIMQNLRHNLLSFWASTWPSYHVIEYHLVTLPFILVVGDKNRFHFPLD